MCSVLRTIFLKALLIQVDVGLHVPYELMGEELGLLRGPQDVLPHVTHLSKNTGKIHEHVHNCPGGCMSQRPMSGGEGTFGKGQVILHLTLS